MGLWTSQNGTLRLKSGHFQMSGQKNGSSDISKWCSEAKIWPFSEVQMKEMGCWTTQNGSLRLNSGHFQISW